MPNKQKCVLVRTGSLMENLWSVNDTKPKPKHEIFPKIDKKLAVFAMKL